MGETPHRWAQAASEWSLSGLSPAAINKEAAVSGPTPNMASRCGRVNLYDLDAITSKEPSQSGAIRTGAFHANLGHFAELLEPTKQRLVARGIGRERLGADQSPERVECRSHVIVQVGVDTARDPGGSFYDGHGHPFLP
jgi:hypothetical protein